MILIVLLIVPIMFWLVPLARMQQQDRNELRRYVINFAAMLLSSTVIGIMLWSMNMNFSTLLVVLLAISAAWAVVFHLITNRRS